MWGIARSYAHGATLKELKATHFYVRIKFESKIKLMLCQIHSRCNIIDFNDITPDLRLVYCTSVACFFQAQIQEGTGWI